MKEPFFIKQFQNKYIGDDGAVLKFQVSSSRFQVIVSDSFFEDVHFKREWMSLREISIKASLVNLSDMIVMNAKPKYAILNVAFPKSLTLKEIKELASGFKETAKKYNYEIIGGDTIENEKIAISVTHIGVTKKAVTRKAKCNEYVAFTGNLGSVGRDLKILLKGGKVSKSSKFIKPVLRDKFFYKASKYITSACDISDGLYKELERISKISHIDYDFFVKFPKRIGCSGEEYEILFTFPKKNLKIIQNIAKITRTPIIVFAITKRGKFRNLCKENHF
ncbi:thiamine-phosphate kinase [Caminibacter profundus]